MGARESKFVIPPCWHGDKTHNLLPGAGQAVIRWLPPKSMPAKHLGQY
jgi:hypothetical protein